MGLRRKNLSIEIFQDPLEALSKFRPGKYHLALIDVRMPRMDGIELSRKLLNIDAKLKVCFLTGLEFVHEEIKKRFTELSQSHFLRKPVSLEELNAKVTSILGI